MTDRHEKTDMDPKYVLYFASALVAGLIGIHFGLWWMFHQLEQQQARRDTVRSFVKVEEPKPEAGLQVNPPGDLEELMRQENEILTTYRWIDREKGTARIPIERAMQLFAERQKKERQKR
jgi:hypothetical protein